MGRRRRSLLSGKDKKKERDNTPVSGSPADIDDAIATLDQDIASGAPSEQAVAADGEAAPAVGSLESSVEAEAEAEAFAAEASLIPERELQYSEEETVMDDDEEDPFAEESFADELAGQSPTHASEPNIATSAPPNLVDLPTVAAVHPDVYIDEEAPTADMTADEPNASVPESVLTAYPVGAGMEVGSDDLGDSGDFNQPPPTEKASDGGYEDLSQSHAAPMNVPSAPDVSEIVDEFTPLPAELPEVGARYADQRPSYLADETPAPAKRNRLPESSKGRYVNLHESPVDDDEDEEELGPGMGRYIVLVGVIVVSIVSVVGGGIITSGIGGAESDAVEEVAASVTYRGVEREKGIRKETPEFVGDVADDGDALAPQPTMAASAPAPEPAAAPAPKAAPEPAAAPASKAAPNPPVAPKPVALFSVIKVRSNRKVLIYVDGKAEGHTPIDVSVGVGAHKVMGMLRGRPDSKQTNSVTIEELGDSPSVSFTF